MWGTENFGAIIRQEEYWRGSLITVRPQAVVEDRAERLILYSGNDWPYLSRAMRHRSELSLAERIQTYLGPQDAPLRAGSNSGRHVLTFSAPDSMHAVWLFWSEDWAVTRWYVNVQTPLRRSVGVARYEDLILDVAVTPELVPSLKDEDEFDALCSAGVYAPEEAALIRQEADRAIQRVIRREFPFDSTWADWRPPESWEPPMAP